MTRAAKPIRVRLPPSSRRGAIGVALNLGEVSASGAHRDGSRSFIRGVRYSTILGMA